MGLSCVLFVVAVNYTRNVDIEYAARQDLPFGQFQIDLSYSTTDTAYPENNLDSVLKENPLDAQLVKDLKSIEGVTEVKSESNYTLMMRRRTSLHRCFRPQAF